MNPWPCHPGCGSSKSASPAVRTCCCRAIARCRCQADEILIKVAAAGVNRPDVLQRMGMYPVPPGASDLPGLEVAGEIVAKGRGEIVQRRR